MGYLFSGPVLLLGLCGLGWAQVSSPTLFRNGLTNLF